MNKIWTTFPEFLQEDYRVIATDKVIPWIKLKDSRILVTGATGEIGREIVSTLLYVNDFFKLNLKILCVIRSVEKFKNLFAKFFVDFDKNLEFICDDIESFDIKHKVDYIIHTASPTASSYFVSQPVETINSIVLGTLNVLKNAKINSVRSMVFLSSMEIYGVLNSENVKENENGIINTMNVRSSYSEAKRLAEALCAAMYHEYDLCVKVARLTLTFGTHLPEKDNRVYAQFMRSIKNGSPIVLHTEGATRRDYIYTLDAVRAILSILLLGNNGEAYNVSNKNTYMSIREMADLIAKFRTGTKVIIDKEAGLNKGYAPVTNICMNNDKLDEINKFEKKTLGIIIKNLLYPSLSAQNIKDKTNRM